MCDVVLWQQTQPNKEVTLLSFTLYMSVFTPSCILAIEYKNMYLLNHDAKQPL